MFVVFLVQREAKELQVIQLALIRAAKRQNHQISISTSSASEGDMFLTLEYNKSKTCYTPQS